jgi:hypothetical protein
MFSKKPSIDLKKSTQKFLDGKRDIQTRFKHLKIVLGECTYSVTFKHIVLTLFMFASPLLDHLETSEAKSLLESHFSSVFHIFFDAFSLTESTLKQKSKNIYNIDLERSINYPLFSVRKGQRIQREELDAVLLLLEKILLLLPELLQQRWQRHSLSRLFKRLLHPANNHKLRRDSMK